MSRLSLRDFIAANGCACDFCLDRYFINNFHPWSYCSEKSSSALWRERSANRKFNEVKTKVENALLEKAKVAIKLGCLPKSTSYFKQLPSVLVEEICSFAGLPEPYKVKPKSMRRGNSTSRGRVVRRVNYSELGIDAQGNDISEQKSSDSTTIDLTDFSLYKPGSKVVIPLLEPKMHLTSACWRDFSRAVRKNDRWDVKRIAATEEEKKEHKEKRKGKVYFINVIFTVPGEPINEERRETVKQRKASRALHQALDSAKGGKQIDPKLLKRALDAGYSSHYVSVQVAKQTKAEASMRPSKRSRKSS